MKNQLLMIVASVVALTAAATGAYGQGVAISVQFDNPGTTGNGGTDVALTPGQIAGVIPVANWNQLSTAAAQPATVVVNNLVESTGATTGASISTYYDQGAYATGVTGTTPDEILNSGGTWIQEATNIATVLNLPTNFTSYDVIVYMLNDHGGRRYGLTLTNNGQTFWGEVFPGATFTSTTGYIYTQATNTTEPAINTDGTDYLPALEANYVLWTNVSGTNFSVIGAVTNFEDDADGTVAVMGVEVFQTVFTGPPIPNTPTVPSPAGLSEYYAGTTVELNETVAAGSKPFTYQWLTDSGTGGTTWTPITGATLTNYTLNTLPLTPNNYEYEVIVSNTLGSVTSQPVTLDIVAASVPIIVNDTAPNPDEDYVGETTEFSATFTGTLPIAYQWMGNTGSGFKAIDGATNDTLVLTNIQAATAGTYYLSATNSISAGVPVTSTPSTLTVLADPSAPGSGTYGATVLAAGPVAYWPLNETGSVTAGDLPAYDASGNNFDGIYGPGSVDDVPGPSATTTPFGFPGFAANNTAVTTTQGSAANAYVSFPPLNIKTNTATITAWIFPGADEVASTGLVFSRDALDAAGLCFGTTIGPSGMPPLGYTWNSNSAATYNYNSGIYPPLGQWSFVALVIDQADASLYVYYLDPTTGKADLFSAVNPVTNEVETFSEGPGATNMIGTDPCCTTARSFDGSIDQVAIFDTALSSSQILAMFSEATGLGPFPPSITVQPQSKGAYAGETVTFSTAGINGTSPLSYQWQLDGTNIIGATNLSFTVSNVSAADEGTYTFLAANSVTTTASSNATLTVITPVTGSYESAVLKLNPLAYWRLDDTNGSPGTGIAYEYVNGLNGVYQSGSEYGYNGILGPEAPQFPGFPETNYALETYQSTSDSYVSGMSAGSMVASNLTYAMWINPPGNVEEDAALLFDRGGAGEGMAFDNEESASGMAGLGYVWNQNSQDTWGWNSQIHPPISQWSFVAMVISPSNGSIYMFNTNGVQYTNNPIPHDTEEFGVAWHIGDDPGYAAGARTFPGLISGVGVYLQALTSNQLVSLYDVGMGITPPPPSVTLDIAKAAAGNVTLTWSAGNLVEATNLSGPWITNTTAVSPYTVTVTNDQTFFEVK